MDKTNLYEILEINNDSSDDDIKKAYNKLVKKWHPDKNINNSKYTKEQINTKFRDIQMSYEILSNETKKKNYDSLNNLQKIHMYDRLKKYFTEKNVYFDKLINHFVVSIYDNNEENFKNDLEDFNFIKIYDTIISKLEDGNINIYNDDDDELSLDSSCSDTSVKSFYDDGNIEICVYVTINEVYNNIYKKITVERTKKEQFVCMVSSYCAIHNETICYKNEGNVKGSDIVITIKLDNSNDELYTISDSNVYYFYEISISKYLYGTNGDPICINYFNNEKIIVEFESFINTIPIYVIKNKGLPADELCKNRGDFVIHFFIKDIDTPEFKKKIENM